jgi:hypothetical protein
MTNHKDRNGRVIKKGDCVLVAITINQEKFLHSFATTICEKRDGKLALSGVHTYQYLVDTNPEHLEKVTPETNVREFEVYCIRKFGRTAMEVKDDLPIAKDYDLTLLNHFYKFAFKWVSKGDEFPKWLLEMIQEFTGNSEEYIKSETPSRMESSLKYTLKQLEKISKYCQVKVKEPSGRIKNTTIMVDAYHIEKMIKRIKGER